MKLSLTDLAPHLQKQGLSLAYVLHGDDPYLQQLAKAQFLNAIDSTVEVLRFHTHHANVWETIHTSLQHRSLFAREQLIIIDVASIKLAADIQSHMKQWLSQTKADYHLVFCMDKLSGKDKQTAWLKALLAIAHEVELTPPNAGRMPQWLKQVLAQKQLSTDTDGLQMLSHYFADNPGAALQEIEKLADYLGEHKHINGNELEQIITAQGQFTVFQLIDSCLAGHQTKMLAMFDMITTDESTLILITWMLAKELRLLIDLSIAMQQGETLQQLTKQYRLWPAKVALYQPLLKRYAYRELWALLHRLASVDKANKGLGKLSAREQLLLILHSIANPRNIPLSET